MKIEEFSADKSSGGDGGNLFGQKGPIQALSGNAAAAAIGLLCLSMIPRALAFKDPCADEFHINFIYNSTTQACDCQGAVKDTTVSGKQYFECVPNSGMAGVPAMENSQAEAQAETVRVNRLGSSGAASIAIGICAKGANKVLKSKSGGLTIGACLDAIVAANKLKDSELKARANAGLNGVVADLEVDMDKLNEPDTAKALKELRKNYGLSRDEFVKRAIATGGSSREFGKILRPRLSLSDYNAAMASVKRTEEALAQRALASVATPETDNQIARPVGGTSLNSGLRNSLRDSLSAYGRSTEPDSEEEPAAELGMRQFATLGYPAQGMTDLRPLDTSGAMASNTEEVEELSIFDVVHRKYRDKETLRRVAPLQSNAN